MPIFEFLHPDTKEVIERFLTYSMASRFDEIVKGAKATARERKEMLDLNLIQDGVFLIRLISGMKHSKGKVPASVLQGDSFPSKRIKISGQMKKRRRVAMRKGRSNLPDPSTLGLKPNVEGEEFKNWEKAKEAAIKKGYNEVQLASFDIAIKQEYELKESHERDMKSI